MPAAECEPAIDAISISAAAARLITSSNSKRFHTPARVFLLLLLVTLPLLNPWVHGDGVGYYAYLHALMIQHNLNFEPEWRAANPTFSESRVSASGELLPNQFTSTGHIDNHFAVGPAMLWAPFLIPVHLGMLALRKMGFNVAADGYSRPYIWTMALATLAYGFAGLWLSYRMARQYAGETWACMGTIAFWFASSFPVYLYLNPSWSHAHSVFAVALFLWLWNRSRADRSIARRIWLGLAGGLMVDVYYLNAILLLVPACDLVRSVFVRFRGGAAGQKLPLLILGNALCAASFAVAVLPTLITRKIIYGGFFRTGYPSAGEWSWLHPVFGKVLLSSDHGLLSWTPIIVLALIGLYFLWRVDREVAAYLSITTAAFTYIIACYVNWDGISSFGNRFFLSLGPIFVIGLGMCFQGISGAIQNRKAALSAVTGMVVIFSAWNFGFIFQWGSHMVPVRGPISWSTMARNQFAAVPGRIWDAGEMYFLERRDLLKQVEQRDLQELKHGAPEHP